MALIVIAPTRVTTHSTRVRRVALTVLGVVTLGNAVSLGLLVHYLVAGGAVSGRSLIESGAVLWASNVLLFAAWFWEMDRGGPAIRFTDPNAMPDFLFPQMDSPEHAPAGWRPGFLDYAYVSLTNSTAFSPTDTHAAHPIGEGGDGRGVGGGAAHDRPRPRARREHPRLSGAGATRAACSRSGTSGG